MKNIGNRLREIYVTEHELTFSTREPAGCKVTVIIPYETE